MTTILGFDTYDNETLADLGGVSGRLVGDRPLRWLGPERGVVHMAIGAVLSACWDLAARRAGKPLWRLLADLSPAEIVGLVDFRYLADVLTPDETLELLGRSAAGKAERATILERDGYPAYSTTPGRLGCSDDRREGRHRLGREPGPVPMSRERCSPRRSAAGNGVVDAFLFQQ